MLTTAAVQLTILAQLFGLASRKMQFSFNSQYSQGKLFLVVLAINLATNARLGLMQPTKTGLIEWWLLS